MNKILILLLVLSATVSHAQSYVFKVLVNKGSNQVQHENAWSDLKTGASLYSGDQLRLSDNAYIGLIHSSGKTLEIKSKGTYAIAELADRVAQKGSSVIAKYTDYVLSKMEAEGETNRMKAAGAATRGLEVWVYLPKLTEVYTQNPVIRWEKKGDEEDYVLQITNMIDEELMTMNVSDTTYTLDLGSSELANEDVILINVYTASNMGSNPGTRGLRKIAPKKMEELKEDLEELGDTVDEGSALERLVLASFYEENDLLLDAFNEYYTAMELAPGVDFYKEEYENFLLRHNLFNPFDE